MGTSFALFFLGLVHFVALVSWIAAEAQQESQILLAFKQDLIDTSGVLNDWNAADPSPCNWTGIRCDDTTKSVVEVDFTYFNLNGTISAAAICQLSNLTALRLAFNYFQQTFPFALAACTKLTHLDLSQNLFYGPLPDNVSQPGLPLRYLDLSFNVFNGSIPGDFGKLSTLQMLNLTGNLLTGSLSPELGNLSSLTSLSAAWNPFDPSPIPPELGKLTQLTYLYLAGCNFTGSIPTQLGTLKELQSLDLTQNNLTGSIPVELMYLPKLEMLELYANKLSGRIPREISNLVSLTDLDASQNFLEGSIPAEISQLQNLRLLQLYHNQLTGEIPPGLAGLRYLHTVSLYTNNLTGTIPQLLGKNSSLLLFDVAKNMLTGEMPPYLCNGGVLQNVSLYHNMLSGPIPESYGNCKSFRRLQLQQNNLEGPVPQGLWTSPNMTVLNVAFNNLSGAVSSDIRSASHLATLILDGNELQDDLPQELGELPHLVKFTASQNRFSGSVPFGSCSSLEYLDLSQNSLSGAIPVDVRNCVKLNSLDLSGNKLSGPIPSAFGGLPNLNALDLSDNHLSGSIPSALGKLALSSLNVSYNNLQGQLPQSWRSLSAASFVGNPGLCGTSACLNATNHSNSRSHPPLAWFVVLVITASALVVLLGVFYIYRQHYKFISHPRWRIKSFHKLSFNEMYVLENLDEKNIIGSGQSGKVYRVDFVSGESVAVKQLWKSEVMHDHEFQAEIETLGKIRHRNIVKLLSCCCNLDSDLLILEYLTNGSLGDVLHGKSVVNLDWRTRLEIALGAAEGLSYLHHDCSPAILHRDIKSNNILLDSNFEAKLADFGLAKLVEAGNYNTMSDVAGSYGYIAPEYAYTLKVSEKSDTYSFGVVLLELVTGKRPIESRFGEGVDIVKWVRSKVHTKGGPQEVLDFRLQGAAAEQQMKMLLNVALVCTSASPAARPSMRQVVGMLKRIKAMGYDEQAYEHAKAYELSPASTSQSSVNCSPYESCTAIVVDAPS